MPTNFLSIPAIHGLKNSERIQHHVVGIGNALVDVIARVDDAFLVEHGLSKGAMALAEIIKAAIKPPGERLLFNNNKAPMVGVPN